jgi:hypothetical protein
MPDEKSVYHGAIEICDAEAGECVVADLCPSARP